MRELQFVSERLEDISRELGVSAYSGFLEETQRKVKKITAAEKFYIDVYKSIAGSSAAKKFNEVFQASADAGYVIRFVDDNSHGIKVFEDIFASTAIVLLEDDEVSNNRIIQQIRQGDEQYRLVVVINITNDADLARKITREFGFRIKAHVLNATDIENKTLPEILSSLVETTQLEKLKKLTYYNSIKPVFSFLQDILSTENSTVQTRKLLNNQNTSITRKEEQSMNNNDLMSTIRQIIQKDSTDLEKIFRGKYDDLNKPNIGEFSQTTDREVKQLEDFDRTVMAEKSERVQITINDSFTSNFIRQIRKKLSGELGKDEAYIKSSYAELISKINSHLKPRGISPIVAEDVYAQFPKQEKVLDSYCYLGKKFTGEIIKKGPAEYFVALRDYTGIIMVAVGLLAPLNAISSLDDVEWLSWLKVMSKGIKYGTAAITVSMIVYGVLDLRRRIPKKRVEEFEREKTKAQEMLAQEGKRIFNESSRDWGGAISNWMRETAQLIQNQIDKNIREMMTNKAQTLNNEKQQQQRAQQSIDLIQRNIQSAERYRDQLMQKFRDLVSESEKDLKL